MGISINTIYSMILAVENNVNFSQTITIGR
ncbi:MAG: hypothetical protein Ta2A_17740 [Treponemataceae bacterium]|nr:MAG: hypothetical protein Ta2A_17740 [Treponemataceae bacterium]